MTLCSAKPTILQKNTWSTAAHVSLTSTSAITRRTRKSVWPPCEESDIQALSARPTFTIVTDHEPLKWLLSTATLEGAQARWACMLQEYDFEITHSPGVLTADALIRLPMPSHVDNTGARLVHDDTLIYALQAHSPDYTAFHTAFATGNPDVLGTYIVTHLNTTVHLASARRMVTHGVILYEPFGGLCAALEAVLRNGVRVHRYYFSDISKPAQLVAHHRKQDLAQLYPH